MPLTPRQSRQLRALAHDLDPVVRVGGAGVTDAVIDKTDKELEIHELLKVKIDADRMRDSKLLQASTGERKIHHAVSSIEAWTEDRGNYTANVR